MSVVILTGPAGSGKNTIAKSFAANQERCAVIDVDTVRQMLVHPHKAPWDGEEGKRQQILGVKNTCALAKNFSQDGSVVLILDVLPQETLSLYRKELSELNLKVVLLLPTFEEIQKRNKGRMQYITDDEILMLYKSQENLQDYDFKIDNTNLSVEEVVKQISIV